jgi:hypothetical protein
MRVESRPGRTAVTLDVTGSDLDFLTPTEQNEKIEI